MAGSTGKLRLYTKFMYGLGQAAEGIKNYAVEWFLFFYYNQVLGLSGKYVGLALLLTLLCDAVMDPLAGSWSDHLHHRWGRRHPFMYASALPLGIGFALVFSAPRQLGEFGLFVWLTLSSILMRAAMALYHVPHLALGAELSDDYQERTAVVGWRIVCGVGGTITLVAGAWNLFFKSTPEFQNGQLNPAVYPGFGALFGVMMAVVILVSSYWTRDRIPYLPKPPPAEPGSQLGRFFHDVLGALKNHSFRYLFVAIVIFFLMRGVQQVLGLHMFTYFWQLSPKQIERVQGAMVMAFALGVPIWALVSRRLDKKPTLIIGMMSFSIFNLVPPMCAVLGMWPPVDSAVSYRLFLLCMALAAFGGAGGFVAGGSMLADVADEHELASRRRQEGIFFGSLSFAGKLAVGFGALIAGITMDFVAFPEQAKVGQVPQPILDKIAIVYGPGIVILAVLAQPFLFKYRISRERHAEILRELAEQRARGMRAEPS